MLGSMYGSLMGLVSGGCPCALDEDDDPDETELGQTVSGQSPAIFGLSSAQIDRSFTAAPGNESLQSKTFAKIRAAGVESEKKLMADENFVEPGSELQAAIAMSMKPLEDDGEDGSNEIDDLVECVVCMDEFTKENPSVRTLCGCGENKSLFHLGCLYEWLDRQPNCPTCRQEIFFEEAMFRVES